MFHCDFFFKLQKSLLHSLAFTIAVPSLLISLTSMPTLLLPHQISAKKIGNESEKTVDKGNGVSDRDDSLTFPFLARPENCLKLKLDEN